MIKTSVLLFISLYDSFYEPNICFWVRKQHFLHFENVKQVVLCCNSFIKNPFIFCSPRHYRPVPEEDTDMDTLKNKSGRKDKGYTEDFTVV